MAVPYTFRTVQRRRAVLGKQIAKLREDLGSIRAPLSYAGLAAELTKHLRRTPKIASSTIQKWENGQGAPDPWALIELARLANVSVELFVYPPAEAADAHLPPEATPESHHGAAGGKAKGER